MTDATHDSERLARVIALLETESLRAWLPRAAMGVLTVDQFLALVLYVIGPDQDSGEAELSIVSAWAREVGMALASKAEISPRDPVTLLELQHQVNSLDGWVLPVDEADWFLTARHMGWSCAHIIEHLRSAIEASATPIGTVGADARGVEWDGERLCNLEDELRKKGVRDYTKQMERITGLKQRRIRAIKSEWRASERAPDTSVGRMVRVLSGKRR